MQKNNKKMTCLAAILMAALAALLIFAIVDANRIKQKFSELQQTVDYEERLEPLLFHGATAETAETAETAATAETAMALEPELNFTATKNGIVPDNSSYVPVMLGDVTVCIPVASAGQDGCIVTYRSGNSTAAIGNYKIALVEGNTEDSIVTFQNDDKEILSGTRAMGEGLTLTVAAEAEEGQETEQEVVIEKLLADAVVTDTAPATTVLGDTLKDDVAIEADNGYLQLQLNDETALVSTFNFNFDKNVFSKALNLPGGLTVRYGNVQDKETGYIPFVSTVNNRNIKILATSVEALQGFFQG